MEPQGMNAGPSQIVMAFLGDLRYDTRATNLMRSLESRGCRVLFLGYDWDTPGFVPVRNSRVRIGRLQKRRLSASFYMRFAVDLAVRLLRLRARAYIACDFYALPFCAIAARVHRASCLYDAREVYTGLPAFQHRPFLRRVVHAVEKWCLKRTDAVFATGDLDARHLEKMYAAKRVFLLRNMPLVRKRIEPVDRGWFFPIPGRGWLLVYQGILVPGRGIETAFEVLRMLPSSRLVLIGEGEFNSRYKRLAESMGIQERVCFAGKVPQDVLLRYTAAADVGLSLVENVGLNNYYALPNKLFEYAMAGIPAIVSAMPQMEAVVREWGIGEVVPERDAAAVVRILKEWEIHPGRYSRIKKRCRVASQKLHWEAEFEKVYPRIKPYLTL